MSCSLSFSEKTFNAAYVGKSDCTVICSEVHRNRDFRFRSSDKLERLIRIISICPANRNQSDISTLQKAHIFLCQQIIYFLTYVSIVDQSLSGISVCYYMDTVGSP